MSNIQKTLDSLQPYVIGIRYLEGVPLVDVVFKEGWTVPDDQNVTKLKGEDAINYYMLYSEKKGVGVDELLAFVSKTIAINLEREKKHDLLRVKVEELKKLFKEHSLTKLTKLKFTFSEDDLTPSLSDFDLNIDDDIKELEVIPNEEIIQTNEEPNIYSSKMVDDLFTEQSIDEDDIVPYYLDSNNNKIEYTEEELEILEEEKRGRRNIELFKNKKNGMVNKVELPPKR